MRPIHLALLLVVLLPIALPAARADEGEQPPVPKRPPALPSGPDAFQGEVERPDLVEYVKTLRRSIEEYQTPPPKTDRVTALWDAWNAILRPRVRRMTKRLEKWEQRKRWIIPRGETKPVALQPDQWTQFTRDMSGLITELHGAWKQYGTVRIKDKEVGLGTHSPPRIPRLYVYGYGPGIHYRGLRDRQLAGWQVGHYDMGTYWHLLNRFYGAWSWRLANRSLYYEYWREQGRLRKQTFENIRNEYENTREALTEQMLGVQALVAAMQNAEEERLLGTCEGCRQDDALREMALVALRDMEDARLEAETYEGDSSARYGSLVRTWLRTRRATVKVLEVVDEKFQESLEDASDEEKASDPAKEYADAPVPPPVPFVDTELRKEADARGEFDDLPEATVANLAALLSRYGALAKEAGAATGRFVGGPAGESYWPTKAEIRLAELGERIETAMAKAPLTDIENAWKKAGLGSDALTYKTFTAVTVKAFGTGYVTVIEPRAKAIAAP